MTIVSPPRHPQSRPKLPTPHPPPPTFRISHFPSFVFVGLGVLRGFVVSSSFNIQNSEFRIQNSPSPTSPIDIPNPPPPAPPPPPSRKSRPIPTRRLFRPIHAKKTLLMTENALPTTKKREKLALFPTKSQTSAPPQLTTALPPYARIPIPLFASCISRSASVPLCLSAFANLAFRISHSPPMV